LEVEFVFFGVFRLVLAGNGEVAGDGLAKKSTADPAVVSEFAGGSLISGCFIVAGQSKWLVWFFCLGLYGVWSLFCQNKLDDVSLYGWMLQKAPFTDRPYGKGSHI
jgi:hypothetical protein